MSQNELYTVVTLSECMQDPATVAWLLQLGVPLPDVIPPGRYPAPVEIRTVAEQMPGFRTVYRISSSVWEVSILSRKDISWATLRVRDYCDDQDLAHQFYFEAGWDEVILQVTARLAQRCGPFVLLHDSGAVPQIIM